MAEQVKDYFKILGVDEDATAKEIQKAYRNLAKTKHPDISDNPNAQQEFELIKEAYEVLSDPDKRKEYEEFVSRQHNGLQTFDDLYECFYSGVEGVYAPVRGEDLLVEVPFTIQDVHKENVQEIHFDRFVNCQDCEGHGFNRKESLVCAYCKSQGYVMRTIETPFGPIQAESICKECSGKGYKETDSCERCHGKGNFNISVVMKYVLPKSTTHEKRVVLAGRGDEGLNGGANGNLILKLLHDPTDEYEIKNTFDLHKTIEIPLYVALEGGQVRFTGPKGKTITIDIPINMNPDSYQVVIPDEGLLNGRTGFKGILTVSFEIEMPRKLSTEKAKKLAEVLKD